MRPFFCHNGRMVLCSIDGCGRKQLARKLCGKHYQRWKRYGDPERVAVIIGDLERRFWSYVGLRGPGCWTWTGHTDKNGYGIIAVNSQNRRAPRVLWEMLHPEDAPLPRNVLVCHSCDNPPCVRPDHLWLGSNDANMADCTAKGRRPSGSRAGVYTKPDSRRYAEDHANSKLTRGQAKELIARREAGEKRVRLAEQFGITPEQVRRIVIGETWHTRDAN
jgi:hypothetical protein